MDWRSYFPFYKNHDEIKNGKCFITIKSAEDYKSQEIGGFRLLIKPITEKNNKKECKLAEQLGVKFHYKIEEGIEIETFCKSLESMANEIRKHYKIKV